MVSGNVCCYLFPFSISCAPRFVQAREATRQVEPDTCQATFLTPTAPHFPSISLSLWAAPYMPALSPGIEASRHFAQQSSPTEVHRTSACKVLLAKYHGPLQEAQGYCDARCKDLREHTALLSCSPRAKTWITPLEPSHLQPCWKMPLAEPSEVIMAG